MLDNATQSPASGQDPAPDSALIDVLDVARERGLIREEDVDAVARLAVQHAIQLAPQDSVPNTLNRLLADGPAAGKALDALAGLFDPADVIELRALDPAGGGSVSLSGRLGTPAERTALADFIAKHNGRRNLYFGANPRCSDMAGTERAGQAADVTGRRAVVLDLDQHAAPPNDPDWNRTRADLGALRPALIVESGNGWHYWFLIEPVAADAATAPLSAIMARLGVDDMSDLPRIARLPWTVNLPTASKKKRGAVPRLALPVRAEPKAVRWPAGALCSELDAVAERLALPGRSKIAGTGGAAPSRLGADGKPKTPHPAPSAALLRRALDLLPNDPGGPFDNRADWVAVGLAVKGAAVAGSFAAEGRDAWLEWCARWGGDPDAPAKVWDGANAVTGWGTLMRLLERHNPAGAEVVHEEAARLAFAAAAATNATAIRAQALCPARAVAAANIPPRPWLYGRSVIAGQISMLVAPGGQGKSALIVAEAVAMATGREVFRGESPIRPLRVWLHNAEDDQDEIERRLAATLKHLGLAEADLGDRLFLSSGRELKAMLGQAGRNGPEVKPGVIDGLVAHILESKIEVVIFDPLGAMLGVPENDNTAANIILDGLRDLAARTGAAVVLLHHTSKGAAADMDTAGAGAARGASAFVDGARIVRQIVRMTSGEATRFGIADEDRRDYFRVENGKANLARAEAARWRRMVDVRLGNGTLEYPSGDHIGVPEAWTPPTAVAGTASELATVQNAIARSQTPCRLSEKSPDWAGWLIALVLGIDAGGPGLPVTARSPAQAQGHARVRSLLAGWLDDGSLRRGRARNPATRKDVDVVEVGKPAALPGQDAPSTEDVKPDGSALDVSALDNGH